MIDRKTKKSAMRELSKDEFEQKIIEISRVTRVQAGGKRMRFRACVVIGDKKGRIGLGIKKGADVSIAVNKAVTAAKRNLIKIKMINDTISHTIIEKFCGAEVFLKPAPAGRGVIAGGPVRAVLELAGIKNVVSKMQGSKNKINNVRATINALTNIRTAEEIKKLRQTD